MNYSGYDASGKYYNTSDLSEYNRLSQAANRKAYGDSEWNFDEPTPSGSNFGNTVTGAQDIYDDPGFYSLTDSGNEFDPSKYSLTGDSGYSDYGDNYSSFSGSDYNADDSYSTPPSSSKNSGNPYGFDGKEGYYDVFGKYNKYGGGVFQNETGSRGSSSSGSGGGGSSGGGSGSTGRNNATGTMGSRYEGLPEMPELPTFAAPARDTSRVDALTRQKSAAGLRAMRAQIQKAMGQGYRNPNVKRMTLREALAGYGQGIESVMSGAQSSAESAYNKEYETTYDTAAKNWNAKNTAILQDWNNKVREYLGQI